MRSEKEIREKIKKHKNVKDDYYSVDTDGSDGQYDDMNMVYVAKYFQIPELDWVLEGPPRYSVEELEKIEKRIYDSKNFIHPNLILWIKENPKKVEEILND